MRFPLISLLLLVAACRTTDTQPRKFADRMTEDPQTSLSSSDSESMSREQFRASYGSLTDEQFEAKWKGALDSPLLFFRSFTNTWYEEAKRLPYSGSLGPCFGDPHPDNFAFLWFGADDFRYVYSDVDDIGVCPSALDALRYFTALKVWTSDAALVDDVQAAYVAALKGNPASADAVDRLKPQRAELEDDMREKLLADGAFKIGDNVTAVDEATKSAIFAALSNAVKSPFKDAAALSVASGGSGGLQRFFALAEDPSSGLQVLEMKEMGPSATALGGWADKQPMTRSDILDRIWGKERPAYFSFVPFQDREFLVRSRLASFLSLDDLDRETRLAVLTYQASLIAELHRPSVGKIDALSSWIKVQSEYLAKRWSAAYHHHATF